MLKELIPGHVRPQLPVIVPYESSFSELGQFETGCWGQAVPEILPPVHVGGRAFSPPSALATQVGCSNLQLIRFPSSLREINEGSPSSPLRQNPSGQLAHCWHGRQSEKNVNDPRGPAGHLMRPLDAERTAVAPAAQRLVSLQCGLRDSQLKAGTTSSSVMQTLHCHLFMMFIFQEC